MSFPVVFDPTTEIGHSNSRRLSPSLYIDSYSTAWYTACYHVYTSMQCGQSKSGLSYHINRMGVCFNTSSLEGQTVSSAQINMTINGDYANTNFCVRVQNGTSMSCPPVSCDYDKSKYGTGYFGSISTTGFYTGYVAVMTLDDEGITNINKTGFTRYMLRSSRDIAGSAPSGQEWFSVTTFKLFIDHSLGNEAPVMDSFAVDTEPGANSGWDLDNNDVQVDFSFHDPDGDSVDLYFTSNKGSQARQPTTADYDYKYSTASNQSNYDLDWTGGSWSDYLGEVYVRVRAHDGTGYSDDASPVLNVDYDYLDYGIDGTDPVTNTNYTGAYRVTSATVNIPADQSDLSIDYLTLYYRSSADNISWGGWSDFGVDNTDPFQWTFTFPDGTGFYEFYTRGTDDAGNVEAAPGSADDIILYNTAPTINDEYPNNESSIGFFKPECYIRIVDADYDLIDVFFYENTTGGYVLRQSYNDVVSNTFQSFNYDQASSTGRFYLKVSVDD